MDGDIGIAFRTTDSNKKVCIRVSKEKPNNFIPSVLSVILPEDKIEITIGTFNSTDLKLFSEALDAVSRLLKIKEDTHGLPF